MSVASAKKFMSRMKTDEKFAMCVGEVKSQEERWGILKACGFHFTENEFNSVCDDHSRMLVEAIARGARLMPCCSGGDSRCKDLTA